MAQAASITADVVAAAVVGDVPRGRRAALTKAIGRVRLYCRDKGYGFVYFPDGSGDAILNGDVLGAHGRTALLPETTVAGRVEETADGRRRLHSIFAIDESTAPPSALALRADTVVAPGRATVTARAKNFDPIRGWGFFSRDAGADVFVHVSVIKDAGLKEIVVGELYEVEVAQGDRGPVARSVARHVPGDGA